MNSSGLFDIFPDAVFVFRSATPRAKSNFLMFSSVDDKRRISVGISYKWKPKQS